MSTPLTAPLRSASSTCAAAVGPDSSAPMASHARAPTPQACARQPWARDCCAMDRTHSAPHRSARTTAAGPHAPPPTPPAVRPACTAHVPCPGPTVAASPPAWPSSFAAASAAQTRCASLTTARTVCVSKERKEISSSDCQRGALFFGLFCGNSKAVVRKRETKRSLGC